MTSLCSGYLVRRSTHVGLPLEADPFDFVESNLILGAVVGGGAAITGGNRSGNAESGLPERLEQARESCESPVFGGFKKQYHNYVHDRRLCSGQLPQNSVR